MGIKHYWEQQTKIMICHSWLCFYFISFFHQTCFAVSSDNCLLFIFIILRK